MGRLNDFNTFNNKNYIMAKDYVEGNFLRLVQHFKIEDLSEDEQKEELIKYFCRFPDQISRFNIQITGRSRNVIPIVNNIGGTIKYR